MEEYDQNLAADEFIGHLKIESVLGMGGFGVTYKAIDPDLEKYFAVKEYLPAELSVRQSNSKSLQPRTGRVDEFKYGLERFLDEGKTLARFNHPNICQVTQFIQANNTAYLVMNYEQGEALDDYLKRVNFQGQMPELEILSIIKPILRGLDAVHKEGLLHRDIKPGNIYLRQNGEPMLIDFGAARYALGEHSKSISAIISMGYAPPEQYTSRGKQGEWTDLYAVGAVIYRLINGKEPIESPDRREALANDEDDPLIPASELGKGQYSEALLKVTDYCLNLSYKQRPQSAAEVLLALDPNDGVVTQVNSGRSGTRRIEEGEHFQSSKEPSSKRPKAASASPKKALPVVPIILLLVLIGAGIGGYMFWQHQQEQARLDKQAWAQARQDNSDTSYQRYMDQWPNGAYLSNAKAAKDKIIAEQKAAATRQRSLLSQVQTALNKLGYTLPISGEEDIRTRRSIEQFERQQGLVVSGKVDQHILEQLKKAYQKRDRAAWLAAKKRHTISAYRNYLNRYGDGQYRNKAEQGVAAIEQSQRDAQARRLQQQRQADTNRWRQAQADNTVASYQRYLQENPAGAYRQQADRAIADIAKAIQAKKERERLQWESLRDSKKADNIRISDLSRYIASNPPAQYRSLAVSLRQTLRYANNPPIAKVARADQRRNMVLIEPDSGESLSSGDKVFIKVGSQLYEYRVSRRIGTQLQVVTFGDSFPKAGDLVFRRK